MKNLIKSVAAFAVIVLSFSLTSCENNTKTYMYYISSSESVTSTTVAEGLALRTYIETIINFDTNQLYTGSVTDCDAAATTWYNNQISSISSTTIQSLTPNSKGIYTLSLFRTEVGGSGYSSVVSTSWILGGGSQ